MFNFTSKTTVNKAFKVNELLKKIGADKVIKDDSKCISDISLKYVLNEQTIGMKPDTIKEIYFFVINLSNMEVPIKFISALDGIIKLQTVFILNCGGNELILTAYKKGVRKGSLKYFQTEWRAIRDSVNLPMVNTLDDLYKFVLNSINKYPAFERETIAEYIVRYNSLKKLDFQIGKTRQAIEYEVESKKRFEYNDRLKGYEKNKQSLLDEKEYEYGKIKDEITGFIAGTHSGD